ncbi:MAG: DUF6587 family protein [Telluria sp.]
MIQDLVVGLIVLAAFAYVLRKYLPASLRRRIVHFLSRRGARQAKVAAWLDTTSSCGSGCDTCKACEPAAAPETPPKHRTIPIRSR